MCKGSKISILGQVSKPSSKRIEIISFATLSNDLKGGAQDPVIFDPFALNGWAPLQAARRFRGLARLSQTG